MSGGGGGPGSLDTAASGFGMNNRTLKVHSYVIYPDINQIDPDNT